MTKKNKVAVHLPVMISRELLEEHPRNSNKQSRHMFKELRESIRENGFDETVTVVPRDDGNDGYWIVAGNHRYRAGSEEGMDEFPCVVRGDWDEVQQQIELVRRNYVRGAIDKDAFTIAVNALSAEQEISVDEIRESMGFSDVDTFMAFYKEENERLEQVARDAAEERQSSAPAINMVDDLGLVLSTIFEEHGDTVPYSFLVFPAGGRNHMFVAATPALVRSLTTVAEYCIGNHLDINVVLGGLLTIGIDASNMIPEGETEEVIEKGSVDLDKPEEF
jgi:hypothetical protein